MPRRTLPSIDILRREYSEEKLSIIKIAEKYGFSPTSVFRNLRKGGVEMRGTPLFDIEKYRANRNARMKGENGKKAVKKLWRKSHRGIYRLYVSASERRGMDFNIPFDKFVSLVTSNCSYCGQDPAMTVTGRNGLDRVNNALGYTIENVVPCCLRCNQMKGKMSRNEFFDHMRRILNHAVTKN